MWMRKWFATRFTFVIFVAFLNCVVMSLQTSSLRKWFTTRFTVIVISSMYEFHMECKGVFRLKRFCTNITIEYFWTIIVIVSVMSTYFNFGVENFFNFFTYFTFKFLHLCKKIKQEMPTNLKSLFGIRFNFYTQIITKPRGFQNVFSNQ